MHTYSSYTHTHVYIIFIYIYMLYHIDCVYGKKDRERETDRDVYGYVNTYTHTLISMHICADRLVRVNKSTNFLDYVRLSSPTITKNLHLTTVLKR